MIAFAFLFTKAALAKATSAQYSDRSPINEQEQIFIQPIESHPDLIDDYFPSREAQVLYNQYRISYPDPEDYVIDLFVNPCGANGTRSVGHGDVLGFDCCMGQFGQGEYGYLNHGDSGSSSTATAPIMTNIEAIAARRQVGPDEVLHNMVLVDEHGVEIPYKNSRRADDYTVIDETCLGFRNPKPACIKDRLLAVKSSMIPPCSDRNQTVDATLSCYTAYGDLQPNCMQISYAQNACIHVCGGEFADDDHCGTFIEIHSPNGSPYDGEEVPIAETKITTRVTNGMTTTTIPLTYKNDSSRILCAYQETKIRVGSMVRITSDSPTCCCPATYSSTQMIGSFFCPKKSGTRNGPFAGSAKSLVDLVQKDKEYITYPYCHAMDENEDVLMCSETIDADESLGLTQDVPYTFRCKALVETRRGTYSKENSIQGEYAQRCPLGDTFQACGLVPFAKKCTGKDFRFSFMGEIGKVVRLPFDTKNGNDNDDRYGVTFNNGRTMYFFPFRELELQIRDANYELWFVQRNRFEKILQKKKEFHVQWPGCTFDSNNDQYFPYLKL